MVGEVVHVGPLSGDLAAEQKDWQKEEVAQSCDETTQAAEEEVVGHSTHEGSVSLGRFVKEQAVLTCLHILEACMIVVLPGEP